MYLCNCNNLYGIKCLSTFYQLFLQKAPNKWSFLHSSQQSVRDKTHQFEIRLVYCLAKLDTYF